MNIYNIFSYKLENFLNVRSCKKAFDGIFYIEDEKDLFLIAAKKVTAMPLLLLAGMI
ncbi:hypothetical protein KKJ06_12035 [Xenorhabdus bovienii]|uniref:hypothetical protein n=1 Tax=Xenorhabdus bovienii TaxID=40576 RepID=UPI0023B24EE7|nr:hypothetical protein [Xenorhabdus bovienii]MDE9556143.1 hypothetical protein [Xenorhabdus bovienii]